MSRKLRLHFPGAVYHVILRGNGGEDIFFSKGDRSKFYFLLQEGIERFGHRILAFCLMTNHIHLVIQVGEKPLSRIMQNVSSRYTRYINIQKQRTGHLFQGRYKAILVDADSFLLELVRYIHNNPVRARLTQTAEQYEWSSHNAYSGSVHISWLSSEPVLSRFSRHKNRARQCYNDFLLKGFDEPHRVEFHTGSHEGRILGDDNFSERALKNAEERFSPVIRLEEIIEEVGRVYNADLACPGKERTATEARAAAAVLIQDISYLTLTKLGLALNRDISSLSQAANRLRKRMRKNKVLREKIEAIHRKIHMR